MHSQIPTALFSRCDKLLLLFFLLTLPLANPWVRGDGVGYYAYARALLFQHNLRFEKDWLAANPTFRMGRVDPAGRIYPEQYTATGHLNNHFSIGPALLWMPILAVTHMGVVTANTLGARLPPDGLSRPYIVAMALATSLYAFLGLWLTFRVARGYFDEHWAFLATVGIWLGTSLPVYMYFNPSWSHAHSVFAVGLFLWYWERTRSGPAPFGLLRTGRQWAVLGLLSGLMMNVYYPNGVLMLIPAVEALGDYRRAWRGAARRLPVFAGLSARHALYVAMALAGFLPTLIAKKIIFGNAFELGYTEEWHWSSPALLQVLFSSNHGLLSWTPILILAIVGLLLCARYDRRMALCLLAGFLGFYYFIASYTTWHGLSSYGNRFFVSLTPLFVLGLAATLQALDRWFASVSSALYTLSLVILLFIAWNVGFLFQWGTHMIPVRGPIVWREMVYNQVYVVPGRIVRSVAGYLTGRRAMMDEIEQRDKQHLESQEPAKKQNE